MWAIDALFSLLTVPDHLGVIPARAVDLFDCPETTSWWKRRVARSGAIAFEFAASVRCGRRMQASFDASIRSNADTPDTTPAPPRRYPRLGASDIPCTGRTFDEMLVLWADRLLQLVEEVETPAALGGSMPCADYYDLVSIDAAVHHASRREKFATGSVECSIMTALESLFEHLTVPDE